MNRINVTTFQSVISIFSLFHTIYMKFFRLIKQFEALEAP